MIPALVQWELTERCNYRCQHCYRLGLDNNAAVSTELSDEKIWQIAKLLADHHLFFVTLTGGEPLVRKQLAIDLSRFLTASGVRVSLNTNLALMDESALKQFKLFGMLISCPSTNSERYQLITRVGSYQRFKQNLKLVISADIHYTVNMVVNKLNFGDVRLTARRMVELGVRRFAATPVSLNSKVPQPDLLLNLEELRQVLDDLIWVHEELGLEVDVMEALPQCAIPDRAFELRLPFINRACFAGRRNGTISPLGDVRPCGHNPNSFGNILTDPIGEIWDRLQDWRGVIGNQHRNCLACDIQSSCDGGCMFSGHPHNPSAMTTQKYLEISHLPGRSVEPFGLNADIMVRPYRQILSRREGNDWLVCSNSSRNLLTVNEALYQFIKKTRELPPMKLVDLASRFGTNYADPDFQSIMVTLIAKSFFHISN